MPLHVCKLCDFTTPLMSNYTTHLETKKHIRNSDAKVKKLAEVGAFRCKYCEHPFKHKSSLSKHIKYSCEKNTDEDLKELIRVMNIKIEEQHTLIQRQNDAIDKLFSKLEIQHLFKYDVSNNKLD